MATGQVLFQRFYYSKSLIRHDVEVRISIFHTNICWKSCSIVRMMHLKSKYFLTLILKQYLYWLSKSKCRNLCNFHRKLFPFILVIFILKLNPYSVISVITFYKSHKYCLRIFKPQICILNSQVHSIFCAIYKVHGPHSFILSVVSIKIRAIRKLLALTCLEILSQDRIHYTYVQTL